MSQQNIGRNVSAKKNRLGNVVNVKQRSASPFDFCDLLMVLTVRPHRIFFHQFLDETISLILK